MSFEKRNALAYINTEHTDRVVVMGDIHGDLDSFQKAVDHWGLKGLLIFLGDYADRGPNGVEVIEGVLNLLQQHPQKVIALKGNHEDYSPEGRPSFSPCTLMYEVEQKKGSWSFYFPTLQHFFDQLYLSAILPGHTLFLHGGICTAMHSPEVLATPEKKVVREILWSDPGPYPGTQSNIRGAGSVFGPDITQQVLSGLGLQSLIRSHQPRKAVRGPAVEHNGHVVTTSSTRVYGGRPFVLDLDLNSYPTGEKDFLDSAVFL
ncbi:MAG: metallophosphoesterase family protein [Spirochaetota bacterium]